METPQCGHGFKETLLNKIQDGSIYQSAHCGQVLNKSIMREVTKHFMKLQGASKRISKWMGHFQVLRTLPIVRIPELKHKIVPSVFSIPKPWKWWLSISFWDSIWVRLRYMGNPIWQKWLYQERKSWLILLDKCYWGDQHSGKEKAIKLPAHSKQEVLLEWFCKNWIAVL